jgi:hypothetical protein
MNTKKFLLGSSALILTVAAGTLIAGSVQAYQGDYTKKGPNYTSERHEAMTKAFENKDYNAWKNLMQGQGKVTQVINSQNFARFAEAHKLALAGKTVEANKIRTELGLGLHNGTGMGQGMGYSRATK